MPVIDICLGDLTNSPVTIISHGQSCGGLAGLHLFLVSANIYECLWWVEAGTPGLHFSPHCSMSRKCASLFLSHYYRAGNWKSVKMKESKVAKGLSGIGITFLSAKAGVLGALLFSTLSYFVSITETLNILLWKQTSLDTIKVCTTLKVAWAGSQPGYKPRTVCLQHYTHVPVHWYTTYPSVLEHPWGKCLFKCSF